MHKRRDRTLQHPKGWFPLLFRCSPTSVIWETWFRWREKGTPNMQNSVTRKVWTLRHSTSLFDSSILPFTFNSSSQRSYRQSLRAKEGESIDRQCYSCKHIIRWALRTWMVYRVPESSRKTAFCCIRVTGITFGDCWNSDSSFRELEQRYRRFG